MIYDSGVMKKYMLTLAVVLVFLVSSGTAFGQIQDGVIEPGEYPFRAEFKGGDFVLYWNVTGDNVAFAMEGKTTGWVSLGIEPTFVMENADMIFGWVDDAGKTYALDTFSTGMFGPHPPDTELGGTEDILAFGGTEKDGRTYFEFLRPLTTGDGYDKPVPASGELSIIWAYGETDNFEEIHIAAGEGVISMASGESKTRRSGFLFLPHMLGMSLSLALMLAAVFISRYLRSRKWWLRTHRPLGIAAGVLAAAGFVFAFLLVGASSADHFRVPHAWFGLAAMAAAFSAPFLGQGFLKSKKNKPLLRTLHRWTGRTAVLLMTVTALLGFYLTGIL